MRPVRINRRSSPDFAVCPLQLERRFNSPYLEHHYRGGCFMRMWFWISILVVTLAGTVSATEQDAKQLAEKGHEVFMKVLGGDEARYGEVVKYMEQSRELDPANTENLYNLA